MKRKLKKLPAVFDIVLASTTSAIVTTMTEKIINCRRPFLPTTCPFRYQDFSMKMTVNKSRTIYTISEISSSVLLIGRTMCALSRAFRLTDFG